MTYTSNPNENTLSTRWVWRGQSGLVHEFEQVTMIATDCKTYECNGNSTHSPKCTWILKSIWRKFTRTCGNVWKMVGVRLGCGSCVYSTLPNGNNWFNKEIFVHDDFCLSFLFATAVRNAYRFFFYFSPRAEQIHALVVRCIVANLW